MGSNYPDAWSLFAGTQASQVFNDLFNLQRVGVLDQDRVSVMRHFDKRNNFVDCLSTNFNCLKMVLIKVFTRIRDEFSIASKMFS